ncbi:unnamed protein product [Symbiodinium sp. KB8]|nr:unnamed protein product [Symbiodinium sp. KB8]
MVEKEIRQNVTDASKFAPQRLISVEHAFSKLPERCLDRQQGRLQASLREGEGGDEPLSAESIADASDITMEPTVDAPLALKDATASGFLPPEEPLLGADDDDIDHASEAGAQPLLEDPLAVEDSNLPSTVTPLLTGSSSPDQPPDSAPLIDEDTTQEAGASSGEALSGPKQEQTAEVADITSLSTQVEDVREPMPEFLLMPTSTAMSYSQALGAMRFLSTISWQDPSKPTAVSNEEPKSEQLNSLANIKDTSAHNVPSRLFYQLRFTPRLSASENMPTAFTALFGAQFVDQMTFLDVTAKKIMDAWKKWRKDRLEIKKWSHRSTSPGRRRIHSYQASITLIDNLTGVEQTWKTEDADGDDWPYGILTDRFKEHVKERHMQQMFIEEFVPMISTYPYIRRLIPGEETSKLIPDPLPVYIQLPTLSGWLTGNNQMDLSHHGREKWVYASKKSKDRGPIHSIGGRRGDQIDQLNFVGQSSVTLPEHDAGGEEMPQKRFRGKICGLDVGGFLVRPRVAMEASASDRPVTPAQLVRAIQELASDGIESDTRIHERIDRLASVQGLWAYICSLERRVATVEVSIAIELRTVWHRMAMALTHSSLFDMGHRTAPAGSLSYGFCRIAPLSGYAGPSVECTRRYNIALVIDFTQALGSLMHSDQRICNAQQFTGITGRTAQTCWPLQWLATLHRIICSLSVPRMGTQISCGSAQLWNWIASVLELAPASYCTAMMALRWAATLPTHCSANIRTEHGFT